MDIEFLIKIAEKSLTLDEFFCIYSICKNEEYRFPKGYFSRVKVSLVGKGYLNSKYEPTISGKLLIKEFDSAEPSKVTKFNGLHKSLVERLEKLTGKKQIRIDKKYSFLPNETDLITVLTKVCKKYKIDNELIIKQLLINHINKAHQSQFKMVKLLNYYISKDNNSDLATDYFNFESSKKEERTDPSLFDGINI